MVARWFVGAAVVRVVLILYALWQDANFEVKYTDIDYAVISDGAAYVAQGFSPFTRATYRYTPLLAYLLQLNVWIHPVAGKVLFASMDILVGVFMYWVLVERLGGKRDAAIRYTALFLFNPIVINVSTRGNADVVVVLLVVMTLHFVLRGDVVPAAVCHGLAVHTRLYPVVFSIAYVFALNSRKGGEARLFRWPGVTFGLISGGVFFALLLAFYVLYGNVFVYEAYLHHFWRADPRHNFSMWFYHIYLTMASAVRVPVWLRLLSFGPQLLATCVVTAALWRDASLCVFVLTWLFVTFNKVSTVQYFVWYYSLLPLILPWCRVPVRRWVVSGGVWVATLAVWFHFAYQLEFQGVNTYLALWASSVAFFAANITFLATFVVHYTPRRLELG